ncbi:MAG TPA: hypothetical protein VHE13_06810 [Opitutus sp.]|nr:hypothetical protein [Opitutus sp.]
MTGTKRAPLPPIHRPPPDPVAPVRMGIWLYAWLLVMEGALRKWFLPQYSDLLFVVRDPVVIGIYFLALRAQIFPFRPAVALLGVLAVLSLVFALEQDTPYVIVAFGLRTNYLHLPLVFVMQAALDRDEVKRFGRWFMVLSLPILVLMFYQFNASPHDVLNAGTGGVELGQLRGAMGRIRPPGPFSFISGVVQWFSLTGAFVAHGWLERGAYRRALLLLATGLVALAVPISISRSLLLGILIVLAFVAAMLLRDLRRIPNLIGPLVGVACLAAATVDTVYVQAFVTRWDEAASAGGGDVYTNVVGRFVGLFAEPFRTAVDAPWLGHGIGMGTVAGARLITGKYQFLLAESELARIILELGPLLGFAFVAWRAWLTIVLVWRGWRRVVEKHDSLPWLLTGGCFLNVLMAQWGQATSLGFSVFGAGLVLAALNDKRTAEA